MESKAKKFFFGVSILFVGFFSSLFIRSATSPIPFAGNATMRLAQSERSVLSASAATSTGATMNVADFNSVDFTIATLKTSSTIQFACSMADTAPTFSTSTSATNRWQYVQVTDLQDGSTIAGNAGIVFTNSTTVRQVQLKTSPFRWCTAVQTTWTAGTSTVMLIGATNQ